MTTGATIGRPSLGPRSRIPWRVPEDLKQAADSRAHTLGFTSINQYLTSLVTDDTGYLPLRARQKGKPLTDAA